MSGMSDIPLSHLLISDTSDIDFKAILDDYRSCFAGHRIQIGTNYNLLNSFDIVFTERDVPHLMGWEKVRKKANSASKIIKDIDSGLWTVRDAKKNRDWFKSKNRILNYNFMHRIFLDEDLVPMVLTSNMKPNRLNLDIVFVHNKAHESVILGLRKAKGNDYFVPTTLHTEKLDNQYNLRRRTRIDSIDWIN